MDSFFNFFDPPQVPDGEEEIDEDTMEELQAIIEADYEVGEGRGGELGRGQLQEMGGRLARLAA